MNRTRKYRVALVCNPGAAAVRAEERKNDKFKDSLAFDIQGGAINKKNNVFLSFEIQTLVFEIQVAPASAGSFFPSKI